MIVTFRCGHSVTLERTVDDYPKCRECGETVVKRVANATPVFRGSCKGPLVKA